MTAFASQLRRLRKEKGLTQEQLSTLLHVTRQTISNWENDRAQPDYDTLSAIAELFEVPRSVLLGEEAAPAPAAVLPVQAEPAPPEQSADVPQTAVPEPEAKPHLKKRILLLLLCVPCVLLFTALGALHASAPPAAFSLEQFTTAAQPTPGTAHLHIYTRENSGRYIQSRPDAEPYWQVRFFMKETGGLDLDISMATTVLFYKDGTQHVDAFTDTLLMDIIGHEHIAPGEMRIFTFVAPAEANVLGVGLEVQARDESGKPLTFVHYQPLEYSPR